MCMSETFWTTVDSFFEDVGRTYRIENKDKFVGVYDGRIRFYVQYLPSKKSEYDSIYGVYKLKVFEPQESPREQSGGTVLYSESHAKPDGFSHVKSLFSRAERIARVLADNDSLYACPYCGFLVCDSWRVEKGLSMISSKPKNRRIPYSGYDSGQEHKVCAGLYSWLPPRVEVYVHDSSENPVFENSRIGACDSLVLAPGYPERQYKTELNHFKGFMLKELLEKHPEVFADELDLETVRRVLCHFDVGEQAELIDYSAFTYRDE